MKTIQRIYLYMVWLVSLEVAVWAAIDLGRSQVTTAEAAQRLDELARSSAFLLVGLLVFALHAWMIYRQVSRDDEERFSRTRATFLYAASLSLGIPAVQNLMAMLERLVAPWLHADPADIFIGGYQTWPENLIAILINLLAAWLVQRLIAADWLALPKGDSYAEMRRAWRYLWLVYGVIITFIGLVQLFSYLFWLYGSRSYDHGSALVDGIILPLVGGLVWAGWWEYIRRTLADGAEARSTFRLVMLYLFAFISGVVAIITAIIFLEEALQGWMEAQEVKSLVDNIGGPLSGALPAAAIWLFFSRVLRREVEAETDLPRRSALRRIYVYVFSLLELGIAVAGAVTLAEPLAQTLLGRFSLAQADTVQTLSSGLALLLVGLPLWLRQWLPARLEARVKEETGEHARRSTTRRVYLYIALFGGVMGVMGTAGGLVFHLFRSLLGVPLEDSDVTMVLLAIALVVFGWLLGYHWRVLRSDRAQAAGQLTKLRSTFQVVVFEPADGRFSAQVGQALQAEAPDIQVVVQPAGQPLPKTLELAGAVVLPSSLAVNPPGALGKWLDKYGGTRLVVPVEAPGWVWAGISETNLEPLSKYAARLAARLAEGQEVKSARFRQAWVVMGYLFALQLSVTLLFILFSIVMSIFQLGS